MFEHSSNMPGPVSACKLDTFTLQAGEVGSMAGPDAKRLADVVSRCGALGSERPKAAFNTKALEGDLGRLLRGGCVEQYRPILERQQAAAAIAGRLLALWVLVGLSA